MNDKCNTNEIKGTQLPYKNGYSYVITVPSHFIKSGLINPQKPIHYIFTQSDDPKVNEDRAAAPESTSTPPTVETDSDKLPCPVLFPTPEKDKEVFLSK